MSECCLTLVAPSELEEKLLDLLLEQAGDAPFTSALVDSHGTGPGPLTALEQVLGRRRACQVQVLLAQDRCQVLLGRLGEQFAGTGLRFWVQPLLQGGVL
ncbi:MAG TPA: DUF3240 family protein [Burkholderiaceae bacterium]|nr:DUF3240 family protein [Burkholderiaceae bacterium]